MKTKKHMMTILLALTMSLALVCSAWTVFGASEVAPEQSVESSVEGDAALLPEESAGVELAVAEEPAVVAESAQDAELAEGETPEEEEAASEVETVEAEEAEQGDSAGASEEPSTPEMQEADVTEPETIPGG